MTTLRFNVTTRLALLAAIGFALLMATTHASAGTQMPPWKWQMMHGAGNGTSYNSNGGPENGQTANGTTDNGNENGSENGNGQTPDYNGDNGTHSGGSGNGGTPNAVPSPSAVAGGLAMLGLMAGRRRRKTEDA